MILKLNKQYKPLKTTSNSISRKMRKIELLTKNTADEELADKENVLVAGSDNVVLDRESEPGKTIIRVTGPGTDIELYPTTNVIVGGEKMALSKYIETTSIDKIKIVNLEEGETQSDAINRVTNWLREEGTPEASRKGLMFIQRKQGEKDIDVEGTYDFYILVRPVENTPSTWRLKRIGGDTFINGAIAGSETNEANFKSYVKPVDKETNVLVGTVRNIDVLVDTDGVDKKAGVYNEKDCISVTRVNRLADILYINTETIEEL